MSPASAASKNNTSNVTNLFAAEAGDLRYFYILIFD